MSAMIAAITYVTEGMQRLLGADVLASAVALVIIVLFLYVEGGPRSRPSH